LVALGAFFLHAHYLHREPVDDAGISVAYARTFASGFGFRITPESPAAEGFSNPSWTFLLAGLELLGLDSLSLLRPLGLAFAALSLMVLMAWGPIAEGRRLRIEDAAPPLIAALHPSFVHWAQGGLELGIQVFGIALLGALALATPTKRTATWFGACAALVTLTRPEGALYATAVSSAWLGKMVLERRRPGQLELRLLLTAAVPVLAYLIFRRSYFSVWLPNTYYAKQHWNFGIEGYLSSFYEAYRPLCLTTLVGFPLALCGNGKTRLRGLCAAAATGSLVYFAYFAKGDWMMEWRFLALIAPFQGAVLACALSALRQLVQRLSAFVTKDPRRGTNTANVSIVVVSIFAAYVLLPAGLARSELVRSQGSNVPVTIAKGTPYVPVTSALANLGMKHPLVIASDMGVVGIGLPDAELHDLAGLTDPALARQFDANGGLEFSLVVDFLTHEGLPTMALAWGPGQFFTNLPFAAQYEEVSHRHFRYRGLTPDKDPRCPDSKQAVLALDRVSLPAAILREARAGDPVRALARWRCAYSYADTRRLPRRSQRVELAEQIEALARAAETQGHAELGLRHYSLCAVLSIKSPRVSMRCRLAAEQRRRQLFGAPPHKAPAKSADAR
jgi:hypothetical protein